MTRLEVEAGEPVQPIKRRDRGLQLDSDLDSPDGKKYGLGSSAAVTVATVKALAAYYSFEDIGKF